MSTIASLQLFSISFRTKAEFKKNNMDKDVLISKAYNKINEIDLYDLESFENDFYFVNSSDGGAAKLYVYLPREHTHRNDIVKVIYNKLNGAWCQLDYHFTLEDFGAIPDGKTECSRAVSIALNSGLVIKQDKHGAYLLNDSIMIKHVGLDFKGFGQGSTVFLLDHYQHGLVYDEPFFKSAKKAVNLSNFTIKRLNSKSYNSRSGPKGLYVSNGGPVAIINIEECYGMGYGIHIDFSTDVIINKCYIHNHKNDMGGDAGTDGIHIYRSQKVLVSNNIIHDIGDDAISAGSFDSNHLAKDISIKNNYIINTKSGIKTYSFAENIEVLNNRVVNSRESGVYITDDANSIDGASISNVRVLKNVFIAIGVSSKSDEAGALRIRFWPNEKTHSDIKNISFDENEVINCKTGVSVLTYNERKKITNLALTGNTFATYKDLNHPSSNTMFLPYILRFVQCYGDLRITGNIFKTNLPYLIKFDLSKQVRTGSRFKARFYFSKNIIAIDRGSKLDEYLINASLLSSPVIGVNKFIPSKLNTQN
ncbi:right-handed parallel beta-helix repeat-containing protein [Erwiniaceae bacterium L1_54_6]|nr:right-handed parallel beta-helix repeat-containing protein [Erwiniaceae bacterium L1_54_6]